MLFKQLLFLFDYIIILTKKLLPQVFKLLIIIIVTEMAIASKML